MLYQLQAQQGWQCPVCKKIYAPFIQECLHCNNVETELKTTDGEGLTIDWNKHWAEKNITHVPTIY